MSKALLSVSILVNIILGFFLLRANLSPDIKTTETGEYLVEQHGRFSIMRNRESSDESFIVALDDGRFYWEINSNSLAAYIPLRQGVTMYLDAAGTKIERTVLEIEPEGGGTIYVTDSNADGVPERRRFSTLSGIQDEIFFEGEFYSYRYENESGKYFVTKDNAEFEVIFGGTHWIAR